MRLDKLLSNCGVCSRKDCAKAAKAGKITVNGIVVKKADTAVDPAHDTVVFAGEPVQYREFFYIMLHKPKGVVSATEDGDVTVLDLLPEQLQKRELFPCGRLDKNTTGFVLMTDDGALAHRLLSPKHHVEKEYRFTVKFPLSDDDIVALEQGIAIGENETTKPCKIALRDERAGVITLREGKYHQIKRMMESVHNQITELSRISFAGLPLDAALSPGEWRELTDAEIEILRKADSIHQENN